MPMIGSKPTGWGSAELAALKVKLAAAKTEPEFNAVLAETETLLGELKRERAIDNSAFEVAVAKADAQEEPRRAEAFLQMAAAYKAEHPWMSMVVTGVDEKKVETQVEKLKAADVAEPKAEVAADDATIKDAESVLNQVRGKLNEVAAAARAAKAWDNDPRIDKTLVITERWKYDSIVATANRMNLTVEAYGAGTSLAFYGTIKVSGPKSLVNEATQLA